MQRTGSTRAPSSDFRAEAIRELRAAEHALNKHVLTAAALMSSKGRQGMRR